MRRLSAAAAVLVLFQLYAGGAPAAEERPAQPKPGRQAADGPKTGGTAPAAPQPGIAATLKAPLFSPLFEDFPVAEVEDVKITLGQLNDALASVHENVTSEKAAGKTDYKPVLDRLINTRLIGLEAQAIGIDALPEVRSAIKNYEGASMREILKNRHTKGVKPDKEETERFYREAVKEWKLKSVIFKKEGDAGKMEADIKSGKGFDDAARPYISGGKARSGGEGQYVRADKLLPQIAGAVSKMKKGSVSPVVKVEDGYVVINVEDVRYPEDPKARAEAGQRSLEHQQYEALKKYYNSLVKKYARINKKLLAGLDFDSRKPPFAKALKDGRVLAAIKGQKSITVADLADTLRQKFFHGVERAVREKKVTEQVTPVFDEMLYNALFDKEAVREGIDKTEEYRKLLDEYKTSLLFSEFIRKVIVPGVKVRESETKKYYKEHPSDFAYPEMVRLDGIAFGDMKDAESAMAKLREGTEFTWLKANAGGRLKADTPGLMVFGGDLVTVETLPADLQKALAGAKAGDYRLYSGPPGQRYVLYVKEETPSRRQPYKEAREVVAKKIFSDKLNKSVADYAEKLRKAHKVRVFITGMGKTSE